jgi:acylphosphatase
MSDASPPQVVLHLIIRGRVQGVGYRHALGMAAQRLGLAGWVRNRFDGSVEAVIEGRRADCDALVHWARRGPPAARVEQVDVRDASAAEARVAGEGFRMLPTA